MNGQMNGYTSTLVEIRTSYKRPTKKWEHKHTKWQNLVAKWDSSHPRDSEYLIPGAPKLCLLAYRIPLSIWSSSWWFWPRLIRSYLPDDWSHPQIPQQRCFAKPANARSFQTGWSLMCHFAVWRPCGDIADLRSMMEGLGHWKRARHSSCATEIDQSESYPIRAMWGNSW